MTDRTTPDSRAAILAVCVLAVGVALAVGAAAGVGDDLSGLAGGDGPAAADSVGAAAADAAGASTADAASGSPGVASSDAPGAPSSTDADPGAADATGPTPAAVSLSCADGTDPGAVFVTDTGLEVEDRTPVGAPYPAFPDDETVAFDDVTLSAASPGDVVLADGSEAAACLSAVNATEHDITVALDAGTTASLEGSFDLLALGDVDYGDDGADLAYDVTGAVTVTLHGTGIEEGETVTAEDADTGDELATGTVAADGSVALSFDAGSHEVALIGDAQAHPLEPYADADGHVQTGGLQDAISDWARGEIDTGLLQDAISYWASGNSIY